MAQALRLTSQTGGTIVIGDMEYPVDRNGIVIGASDEQIKELGALRGFQIVTLDKVPQPTTEPATQGLTAPRPVPPPKAPGAPAAPPAARQSPAQRDASQADVFLTLAPGGNVSRVAATLLKKILEREGYEVPVDAVATALAECYSTVATARERQEAVKAEQAKRGAGPAGSAKPSPTPEAGSLETDGPGDDEDEEGTDEMAKAVESGELDAEAFIASRAAELETESIADLRTRYKALFNRGLKPGTTKHNAAREIASQEAENRGMFAQE